MTSSVGCPLVHRVMSVVQHHNNSLCCNAAAEWARVTREYCLMTQFYLSMQVSLLPSRIHVSGLDDIWHMSLSLNTGNVVTFDLSLPTDLVV
jgi:hypothetical protein